MPRSEHPNRPDAFADALGYRRGHPDHARAGRPDRATVIAHAVADSEQFPGVFANPGAGSVLAYGDSITRRDAQANLAALIADTGAAFAVSAGSEDPDAGGRYRFALTAPDRCIIEVLMPGLPLDCVRFAAGTHGALAFPRLYVDGSSRWWPYAVSQLQSAANGDR